jgi:AraC-like DNA-binding protein
VHANRRTHGIAFNTAHTTIYRFSDGTVLTCQSGQCIYLPQGSSYTVDRTEASGDPAAGVHAINFCLEAPLAERPFVLHVRAHSQFLSAYEQAEKLWRQRRPGYRESCFSQLYSLLSMVVQEGNGYVNTSRSLLLITPALEYIRENLTSQELTAPHLAQLCAVSQPYLRRLFRSAFGMPPAQYVRHRRLIYARELLETGEYSVSRVAVAAGFNDTAYFSREFRKAFGISPSKI